jgi:hypothetical protein
LAYGVLGLGLRTFDRLVSEGVLVATRTGRGGRASLFDLREIVPSFIAHERKHRAAAGGGDETPRDRRDRAMAQVYELKLARERLELLPRDQVVAEGRQFVVAAMAKIRQLPRKLAQAGLIDREDEPAAMTLTKEAQEEISRWSSHIDLLEASREPA